MSRRGLPETVRMRHDEHYVEALTASAGTPVGRMVPIDLTTNETQASDPAITWHLAYHLQKLSGTWKVVEAVQLAYD